MNIESLKYFCEVAKHRSINGAASTLFISQQGLNKSLSLLEKQLGVVLLERNYNGVQLTSFGAELLPFARSIVAEYEDMIHRANRLSAAEVSTKLITVLCTPFALQSFYDLDAGVRKITMVEKEFSQIIREICTPGTDFLAFVDLFVRDEDRKNRISHYFSKDEYHFSPVFQTKLGIIVEANNPLARLDTISLEELCEMPLGMVSDSTIDAVLNTVLADKTLNNVQFRTGNLNVLVQWTQKRKLPLLLDSYAFWVLCSNISAARELRFIPLQTNVYDVIGFVWRTDAPNEQLLALQAQHMKALFTATRQNYLQGFL